MRRVNETELVAAYCRHLAHLGSIPIPTTRDELLEARDLVQIAFETDDSLWATEELSVLMNEDQAAAWRVLRAVIDECEERSLYIVGTGDLENFVRSMCPQFDSEIEDELRRSSRFRSAFRHAFLFDVPETSWRRFHAVLIENGVDAGELPDWSQLKV